MVFDPKSTYFELPTKTYHVYCSYLINFSLNWFFDLYKSKKKKKKKERISSERSGRLPAGPVVGPGWPRFLGRWIRILVLRSCSGLEGPTGSPQRVRRVAACSKGKLVIDILSIWCQEYQKMSYGLYMVFFLMRKLNRWNRLCYNSGYKLLLPDAQD